MTTMRCWQQDASDTICIVVIPDPFVQVTMSHDVRLFHLQPAMCAFACAIIEALQLSPLYALGFHDFMQLACRNMQKQSTVTVSTT